MEEAGEDRKREWEGEGEGQGVGEEAEEVDMVTQEVQEAEPRRGDERRRAERSGVSGEEHIRSLHRIDGLRCTLVLWLPRLRREFGLVGPRARMSQSRLVDGTSDALVSCENVAWARQLGV